MTSAAGVSGKKRQLDALRKRARPGALDGLEHSQRIDITYTSNAIEGNTLTAGETALVLEKGITISGKPLKDHLEAIDHARALNWILEIASKDDHPILEADIRNLYHLVVANSKPEIAGQYADSPRYVNTNSGVFNFPAPVQVPAPMQTFCKWLSTASNTPRTAFEAHRRFVAIHPFNDGNGRTAWLLMNLVLARRAIHRWRYVPKTAPSILPRLRSTSAAVATPPSTSCFSQGLTRLWTYIWTPRVRHRILLPGPAE